MNTLLKKHSLIENYKALNKIVMKIESNYTHFYNLDTKESLVIPIGFNTISTKFFKNSPPLYDEIEYAINYIEDEIEKLVKKLPSSYSIFSSDSFVIEFGLMCGIVIEDVKIFEKDKLEYLFGQYAEVSVGKVPQSFQRDLSPIFYSKLLILREYMHHLKFENFYIFYEKDVV